MEHIVNAWKTKELFTLLQVNIQTFCVLSGCWMEFRNTEHNALEACKHAMLKVDNEKRGACSDE
eukprot:1139922-Pelagomonas_calceolata.AAC.2